MSAPGHDPPGLLRAALIATAFTALGPITMSMYAPSMPVLATALDTTPSQVQLTLTVYLVAFAVATLVYGPVSDRFGRRPAMIAGTLIYIGGSLQATFATSIEALMVARFVEAVGACAGPALARAMVRDQFHGPAAAKVMAIIGMAITVAPAVGPVLGGYLQAWFDWQAVFLFLSLAGAALLLVTLTLVEETNRRPDPSAVNVRHMLLNYGTLLRSRTFMGYVAVGSFSMGGMMAFVVAAPFVFIDIIGLSPQAYGWTSVLTTAAYFVGSTAATRMAGRVDLDRMVMIGATAGLGGGLLLLATTVIGYVTVASIIIPMMLWVGGMGLLFPGSLTGAMMPYPRIAGAASALLGFIQMGVGALASLGVSALYDGSARPLGLVPAGLAVISIVLFRQLVWRHRGRRDGETAPQPGE